MLYSIIPGGAARSKDGRGCRLIVSFIIANRSVIRRCGTVIKTSLSEKAYNRVREKVIGLDGGQYLSIREFANEIGVSYTPAREAFQRLEKEGLLERIPNVGYFVPRINIRHIEEIFQVRECLELFVLDKVFTAMSSQDLDFLSECTSNQESCLKKKDIQQYIIWDQRFHMRPFEIYKNSYFLDLIKNVREKHLICSIKIARRESNIAINEHREIINYLKNGDRNHALSTLGLHIENAKQRMKTGFISLSQWPAG